MLDTCPQCNKESVPAGISKTRGKIFKCGFCRVRTPKTEEKTSLLWFWESDRLWEDLDQPESVEKPKLVKVILVIEPDEIDYVNQ